MNLKERLALRKVATYRISWMEQKCLKQKIESCKSILKRVETRINNYPELMYFYIDNPPKSEEQSIDASKFRTPLLWATFNATILSLRAAWDEIHPYPFEENDIVYPGEYVEELDGLSEYILTLTDVAVRVFGLDGVIDYSAHLIFDETPIPPMYVSHFEIMIKYLKRYVKDHTFDPLKIFTPRMLELANQLIQYAETNRKIFPIIPLKIESEDSL